MQNENNLDGRSRDENGRIRAKNGATLLDTLRREYGPDFGQGHRADQKLDNFLNDTGYSSLSQYLKNRKD
jgi:hypothetical protein